MQTNRKLMITKYSTPDFNLSQSVDIKGTARK